jgi:phosphohistidine phosphatase
MKRRLMVMRHAKSSWESDASTDHERPLNKRGKRDAPRIAAHLDEIGWRPELVLSSTSERTRQTWKRMRERFPEARVQYTNELYLCDAEDAIAQIAGLPDEIGSVLVLGHNPGFEDLVEELTGRWHRMTTANVALFAGTGATWAEALSNGVELQRVIRPKEL